GAAGGAAGLPDGTGSHARRCGRAGDLERRGGTALPPPGGSPPAGGRGGGAWPGPATAGRCLGTAGADAVAAGQRRRVDGLHGERGAGGCFPPRESRLPQRPAPRERWGRRRRPKRERNVVAGEVALREEARGEVRRPGSPRGRGTPRP